MPLCGVVATALIDHAPFVDGPVDDVEDPADPVEPEEVPGGRAVAAVVE